MCDLYSLVFCEYEPLRTVWPSIHTMSTAVESPLTCAPVMTASDFLHPAAGLGPPPAGGFGLDPPPAGGLGPGPGAGPNLALAHTGGQSFADVHFPWWWSILLILPELSSTMFHASFTGALPMLSVFFARYVASWYWPDALLSSVHISVTSTELPADLVALITPTAVFE